MTTMARSILLFAALLVAASLLAQDLKPPPNPGRYTVTKKDSAGKLIYLTSSRPFLEISNAPYDTVKVRRNWSKLRKGMTQKEVGLLFGLGRHVQVDMENGFEYWYYGQRAVGFRLGQKKVVFWDK